MQFSMILANLYGERSPLVEFGAHDIIIELLLAMRAATIFMIRGSTADAVVLGGDLVPPQYRPVDHRSIDTREYNRFRLFCVRNEAEEFP